MISWQHVMGIPHLIQGIEMLLWENKKSWDLNRVLGLKTGMSWGIFKTEKEECAKALWQENPAQ